MPPTSALSTSPLSTSPQQSQTLAEMTKASAHAEDYADYLDNSCETYFCKCDFSSPSPRTVIPEASDAFREVMIKMKDDEARLGYAPITSSLPSFSSSTLSTSTTSSSSSKPKVKTSSSPPKESKSLFQRLSQSRFTSSSSSSSKSLLLLLSPSKQSSSSSSSSSSSPNRLAAPTSSKRSSNMDSKRPASFGGADVEKPRTSRRASHYDNGSEKRVSWADERGSQHQLINVRLIRPRVDKDCSTGFNKTPGQSILRHSGTK